MKEEILRLNPLAHEELSQVASAGDLLWRAEEYRRMLGPDSYSSLMRKLFAPKDAPVDRFHELLVRLPFRHILTTNYDAVLEDAHSYVFRSVARRVEWRDQADVQEFIHKLGDPVVSSRRYVYLHGRYHDVESMVLTESDYSSHYCMRADTLPKLWALLATQRVVSIGFSLSDLDLMALFRMVKGHLGPGGPRHFAILPHETNRDTAGERRRLSGKYGIEPIFYPSSSDHSALVGLLEELVRETNAGTGSACDDDAAAANSFPSHPDLVVPLVPSTSTNQVMLTAGQYVRLQRQARAVLERLEAQGRQLGWQSVESRVESLRSALHDNLYRVAITGRSRAGKSSLLNALLERPICPVQRTITTGVPINIFSGEQERAIIRFENGFSVALEAPLDAGHLAPFVSQQHNPDNSKQVASIEVQLTHEVLDLGVAYIDLPGLDDPSPRLATAAGQVLSTAHALLLIIDVSSYSSGGFALDRQTVDFLREMRNRGAPTFMVCNKSDRLNTEEQRELAQYLRTTMEANAVWNALAAPPFFLSASQACEAQRNRLPVPRSFGSFSDTLWNSLWRSESIGLRRLYHVFDQLRIASEEMAALMQLRQTQGTERENLRLVLEKCDTTRVDIARRCREHVQQEREWLRQLLRQVQERLKGAVTQHIVLQSKAQNRAISLLSDQVVGRVREECNQVAQMASIRMEGIARDMCNEAATSLQTLWAEVGVQPSKWKDELTSLPSWQKDISLPMLTAWDRYARLAGTSAFTAAVSKTALFALLGGPFIGFFAANLILLMVTLLRGTFPSQALTADERVNTCLQFVDKCLTDFGQRIEAWQGQVADGLLAQISGQTQPFMSDIRNRLADLRPPTEDELRQHALLDEDIQRTLGLLVAIVRTPGPTH